MVLGRRPLRGTAITPRDVWVLAAAGMLPDVDLLFGLHSGPTHGLGAAVLIGVAALALPRVGPAGAAGIAAAYASHTLLDWLGSDTSPPIGIMALWPVSRRYFQSGLHVFHAISRRYWLPEQFIRGNLLALLRELVMLGPVAGAAVAWRAGNFQRPVSNSQEESPERTGRKTQR